MGVLRGRTVEDLAAVPISVLCAIIEWFGNKAGFFCNSLPASFLTLSALYSHVCGHGRIL